MTRRRTTWVVVTALGVLVAIGVPVGWSLTRPAETVDAQVAETLASMTPAPSTAAPTASAVAAPVPPVPTQDGRVGAGGGPVAVPARLELPSLDVSSAVEPVGVDGEGDLEIPENVAEVGWYRFGPRPGDAVGSTVLSGHVDSAEQGKGAFFRLRDLKPGDPVVIRGSDGRTWRYRVVSREEWPKSEVPLDRIFSRSGAARITLVTCGGGFREDIRSYQDNIAVTAVPVGTR
ncbi:MAG TPA: class F sortase [Mycobacteriales bacterium]